MKENKTTYIEKCSKCVKIMPCDAKIEPLEVLICEDCSGTGGAQLVNYFFNISHIRTEFHSCKNDR